MTAMMNAGDAGLADIMGTGPNKRPREEMTAEQKAMALGSALNGQTLLVMNDKLDSDDDEEERRRQKKARKKEKVCWVFPLFFLVPHDPFLIPPPPP